MILRFEIEVFGYNIFVELSRGEHRLRDDVAKRSTLMELWLSVGTGDACHRCGCVFLFSTPTSLGATIECLRKFVDETYR